MKPSTGFAASMQQNGVDVQPDEAAAVRHGVQRAAVIRREGGAETPAEDLLAVEEPLEIQLEYGSSEDRESKPISITMRTPGHDKELAAGFLMTEGVLSDPGDIKAIARGGQNIVRVELMPGAAVKTASLARNFYITSSCGVCGKASLLALQAACPPRRTNRFRMREETLRGLPERLRQQQTLFKRTGGLHAAGLFDAEGNLCVVREDVGRHNAVDKLIGSEWLADRTPLHERVLLLSGRASFELLQKAVMAGIPMVACVGAPSSLAVTIAQQFDVILAGFLREDSFNIYHGAQRID
jgi:FdhD protein